MVSYNANVALGHVSSNGPVNMSQETAVEMERRRRRRGRACKHGRTKAGRCRKRGR